MWHNSVQTYTSNLQRWPFTVQSKTTEKLDQQERGIHEANLCDKLHIAHYNDVIIGAMASQLSSLAIVYSTVSSGAEWPVTRKRFPLDDVIMNGLNGSASSIRVDLNYLPHLSVGKWYKVRICFFCAPQNKFVVIPLKTINRTIFTHQFNVSFNLFTFCWWCHKWSQNTLRDYWTAMGTNQKEI